jgi:LAO/AO transport system kinase
MLTLGGPPARGWVPPVLPVVATRDEGVAELADAIARHQEHLRTTGELTRREQARAARELEAIIREEALARVQAGPGQAGWEALIARVARREIDPYTAADEALGGVARPAPPAHA